MLVFGLTALPGGLFFVLVGAGLYDRQFWGERFARDAGQRFLAKHAPDIRARLREDEKLHEHAWLMEAHGGAQTSRWLLAVATSQRVVVVESVWLGLDVIFRRSIPIGAVGWLRVKPDPELSGALVGSPVGGSRAQLEIEHLTEGMSYLEFVEIERAAAFFMAISSLRKAGTAGVGALSIPEPSAAGGLSVAESAGGLSGRS